MSPDDFRAIRAKTLGLTPYELAPLMGVHVRTIQRWENGERSVPGIAVALLEYLQRDHELVSKRNHKN